jgi:peptidoglycan hydrolase-like protein with peptidoglycan-binding domain
LPEELSEPITGIQNRGEAMLLAGKGACAGIAFILLTIGISAPRLTPLPSGASQVTGVAQPNDVKKMQQTLQDKGHYRGKVDGVFGLRTRASVRAYQKAENLPVTGELDTQTAGKLGLTAEVRDEAGYKTTQDKPSAAIKWAKGSRRTHKTPWKAVKTVATSESSSVDREKRLQAENDSQQQ